MRTLDAIRDKPIVVQYSNKKEHDALIELDGGRVPAYSSDKRTPVGYIAYSIGGSSYLNEEEVRQYIYGVLQASEFIEKKKVIGYKIKDGYNDAAIKITGVKSATFVENMDMRGVHFSIRSVIRYKLDRLKVLDIWCEPVYEKQEPKLPKIYGYEGTLEGDCVKYGCAKLPIAWFTKSENRYITSMTFNSDVVINIKDIEKIREYLTKKGKI